MTIEHDEAILATLREATTKLARRKVEADIEKDERETLKTQYQNIVMGLKDRMKSLVDELNNVSAMLWNARFPDSTLPKDTAVYKLGHLVSTHPVFEPTVGRVGWDGDPENVSVSCDIYWASVLKEPVALARSCFRLNESLDRGMAIMVKSDGTWSFGHEYGLRYLAGGVTTVEAFIDTVTKKLEKL